MLEKDTIFGGLITSKMRIRILMRLFLNPEQRTYLRELSAEFNASPSQVRDELNRMSDAGLLESNRTGRQTFYCANRSHPLFPELQSMIKKALGMDHIVESILQRLGDLEQAFLIDDYAEGKDSGLIDLVLVGEIDKKNLDDLVAKAERYIKRKIRTLVISREEHEAMKGLFKNRSRLILWESGTVKAS